MIVALSGEVGYTVWSLFKKLLLWMVVCSFGHHSKLWDDDTEKRLTRLDASQLTAILTPTTISYLAVVRIFENFELPVAVLKKQLLVFVLDDSR
jgi:hypothetical protein